MGSRRARLGKTERSRAGAAAGTHTRTHTHGELAAPSPAGASRRGSSEVPEGERPLCPRCLRAPAGEGEGRLRRAGPGWRSGGALPCPPAAPPPVSPPLRLQQTPGLPDLGSWGGSRLPGPRLGGAGGNGCFPLRELSRAGDFQPGLFAASLCSPCTWTYQETWTYGEVGQEGRKSR